MALPCPGNIVRSRLPAGAAHQLSILQADEPVSSFSGDGGFWRVCQEDTSQLGLLLFFK